MTQILGGAGGGRGGKPTIVADNKRSQDSVEFILGICEGPIAGLIDGPQSFYLNDTPLQSASGQDNFEAFELHTYAGADAASRIFPQFGGTASNIQVGVPLAQYVPITRTTPSSVRGVTDRLEVRIVFNQLVLTNDKGDQLDATATYRILYKRSDQANWRAFVGGTEGGASLKMSSIGNGRNGTVSSRVDNTPFSGNLAVSSQKQQASMVLAGAVFAPVWIGPNYYTHRADKPYASMYFNPSNGNYFIATDSAGLSQISSNVNVSWTIGGSDSRGSNMVTVSMLASPQGIVTLSGKTNSSYVKEYVRAIPDADRSYTGDWDIRVEKLTADTDQYLFVDMSWESFQCIDTDQNLTFNNLALVRGLGASSNQFTSMPTFSGIYAGKLVRMPTNYNPITRVYTGIWNGTFKIGYTDNPAWCLYDLLVDTKYGFKAHYPELVVDKWSFYEAAQWCDVLVPRSGATGFQPRYTYHDLMDQPRAGLEAAQYIASIFGGILNTDLNGTIRLKLDKPGTPVQIFGPESVSIDGFQYQFADMTSRANEMLVTFINPELNWSQDVREVSVPSYVTANGRIPMDFVAVGCIDPFEAQRRAQIRMISANTEITTVTFTAARPGMLLEPYDLIGITDPYMNWGVAGRIKTRVGNVITLRDPLFLSGLANYTMTVQTKTGPVDVTVQNTGGSVSKELTIISGTLTADLPDHAQFALASTTIGLVKPFRVLSIQEDDSDADMFTISAIEVNLNKYGDADNMTASPPRKYAFEQSLIPATPVDVECESGTRHLYVTGSGMVQARIQVTWEQDPTSFVEKYEVHYRRADRDAYSMLTVNGTDAYIPNVEEGMIYQIFVRAVNNLNRKSPASAITSHTVIGKDEPPSVPVNAVTTQIGPDIRVDWDDITDLDLSHYEVRLGGTTWENAARLGTSKASVYTHANASSGTLIYRIKSVDTSNNFSTVALSKTHTVPLPLQPSMTVSLSGPNYVARITPPAGDVVPIKEYVLKLNGTEVFRGASTTYSARVTWTGSRTFDVAAVNTAGQVSPSFTATLSITPPAAVSLQQYFSEGNAVLSWNIPSASLPIERYIVRNKTGGVILDADLKATTYIIPVRWTGSREFEVTAVDSAGNLGTPASVVCTVVPPVVQNLQSRLFRSTLELTWQSTAGTLPIKNYSVHLGETFLSSTYYMLGIPGEDQEGAVIATLNALNYSTPVDWNGTRSYYIVAHDIMDNLSEPSRVFETVDPPEAPGVTATVVDKSIRLQWIQPSSELRVREYEIYRDDELVQKVSATAVLVPINFSGPKTYRVRAIDEAGNPGAYGEAIVNISAPSSFVFDGVIVKDEVRLSWTTPTGSLPISEYVITRGVADTLVTRISANSFALKVNWLGSETFKITAYDIAGNSSPVQAKSLTVSATTAPVVRPEVLDNNVLLRWTLGTGTLPIVATEIRRGAVFATATVLQTVDATFATFFEFSAGNYTYWLVHIDTAGNYGTPSQSSVTVTQPPDFILQTDFDSNLGGTRTLSLLDAGKLYFGVDPVQSYQNHFIADSFASPQAQIAAGFPLFLQPNNTGNASYQEIFDYGAVLISSLITVTPTVESISGNPTMLVDIEARETTTAPWTMIANGVNQGFASNFRYVRFTLRMIKDSRDDLISVSRINIRLNSKLITDSGKGVANAADTTGTQVNFSTGFVDIQSISVTPLSTTARVAVYDFVDAPYPTNFKVYLYDTNGNRLTGDFSWQARGF